MAQETNCRLHLMAEAAERLSMRSLCWQLSSMELIEIRLTERRESLAVETVAFLKVDVAATFRIAAGFGCLPVSIAAG